MNKIVISGGTVGSITVSGSESEVHIEQDGLVVHVRSRSGRTIVLHGKDLESLRGQLRDAARWGDYHGEQVSVERDGITIGVISSEGISEDEKR